MTTLYWLYLLPVFARIMGCIGVLLALFACYIYIQFYNYDRCEYYSNTYHKWFTDAIDVDKECGYMIAYDKTRTTDDSYQIVHINSDTDMYFGNIMFKNEADVQYVIDNPNFRDILDNIFKV